MGLKIEKEQVKETMSRIGEKIYGVISDVPEKASEGTEKIKLQYDKAKYDFDKKRFAPVFQKDLENNDIIFPTLLRVIDSDKRQENEACKGAIGFFEKIKNENVLHIYTDNAHMTGIEFFPCIEETIYCINPYQTNSYICLDEYFKHIKEAKVNELEMVAKSLGAKHVEISFKERKKSIVKQKNKLKGDAKKLVEGEITQLNVDDNFSKTEVASTISFSGNSVPIEPELKYFKSASDINTLIKMRLDDNTQNEIKEKTYRFEYDSKRDMELDTAASIDSVIKKIGCTGNVSVVSEVQEETRTVLEYTITF